MTWTFFNGAYRKPEVEFVKSYIKTCLIDLLHADVCGIITDYILWIIKVGSLVDVSGSTAKLNMFAPALERWVR